MMSAFEFILEIIRNAAPVAFCSLFLKPRFNKKLSTVCYLGALVLTVSSVFITDMLLDDSRFVKTVVFMTFLLVYCVNCRKGSFKAQVLIPSFVYLLYFGTDMMFYVLMYFARICVTCFQMFLRSGMMITGIGNLIRMTPRFNLLKNIFIAGLYLLTYYTAYRFRRGDYTLRARDIDAVLAFFAVVLAGSILYIPYIYDTLGRIAASPYIIYIIASILAAFSISMIFIIVMVRVSKSNEIKRNNMFILRETEKYKEKIKNDNKYIEEIAAVKHNLKNKLLCINELIEKNDLERVRQICADINKELEDTPGIFSSRNPYLNSILNVIYKKAREKNIDVKVTPQSDLESIDGSDLITILGNFGDNAVEALAGISKDLRVLRMFLLEKGGYYIIIMKNSIEGSVLANNPDLTTGKADTMYHGYGLKTVKSIIEKYDGSLEFSEEDSMFIVSAMIKIPSTTKK